MDEIIINKETEKEEVTRGADFMNSVKSQLNDFLEKDATTDREPDYAKPEDVPYPKMMEDGNWNIPGTELIFETEAQALAAISRYKAFAKQNAASLIIHGISFREYMGE